LQLQSSLLDFLVRVVLPAVRTELLHFQPFGGGFFVLGAGVVPVFALGALERDDFAWHLLTSYDGGPSGRLFVLN
jgi:hypothetical protein